MMEASSVMIVMKKKVNARPPFTVIDVDVCRGCIGRAEFHRMIAVGENRSLTE